MNDAPTADAKVESVLRKPVHEWRVPLSRDVMATVVLSAKEPFEPSREDLGALAEYVALFQRQMKPDVAPFTAESLNRMEDAKVAAEYLERHPEERPAST